MSQSKKVSERASKNQDGTDEEYEEDPKESARKSEDPRPSKITDLVYKYLDTSNSQGSLDEVSPQSSTSGADDRVGMASDKKRSRKQREGSKFTDKYIRDALAFGIRSGSLIPVDSNCRILRVSSALANVKDRRGGVSANERSLSCQKSQHDSESSAKGEIQEARRRRRRSKRRRSRTRSRSSRRRKVHRRSSKSHEDSRAKSPDAASKPKKVPVAKRTEDPEEPDDYETYSGDEDNDSKKNSNSNSNDGKKGKTENSTHQDKDKNDTNDNEIDEYISDNSVDEDVSDDDEDKKD